MFRKIVIMTGVCLILVIILKIRGFIYDRVNKKVIGKMKDEVKEKIINEFAGLKSKMYSLVPGDNIKNKKGKGVNKIVVSIRPKKYGDVLFSKV